MQGHTIQQALEQKQFILHYQPQFNLITKQFEAVEALIRWQHPQLGLLSPHQFLPQVEEHGFLSTLSKWVIHAACKQTTLWHEQGFSLRVAVNLPGELLQQKDFIPFVKDTLYQQNHQSNFLEFELMENCILYDDLIANIKLLKALGVSLALDDFGTGYSSISYLKKIPIDRLKIDKTFIDQINHNHQDVAIVRAIIALTNTLNLTVLAEGVESYAQLQLLLAHECKEAQGFYFSKPLSSAAVTKFLEFYKANPFEFNQDQIN